MRYFLDDVRKAPTGWVLCRDVPELLNLLSEHQDITEISLDHDLGDDNPWTGYDVINWIEEKVVSDESYIPPKIIVHSANPPAMKIMKDGINSINEILNGRK